MNKEAYSALSKHVFVAYRTYSEDRDNDMIIIAEDKKEAQKIASRYFDDSGRFITVRQIAPTSHEQVYEM